MNIFRILSSNDGSINEPNVSSFLAYLLDPNEDHGLSSLLLQEILNQIIEVDYEFLKKIRLGNKVKDLSKYSGYSINVFPELTVSIQEGIKKKRRDIDIVLEIKENKTEEILYSICIENKITDSSIIKNDSQLEEELKGIENYYFEREISPEIYIVYLTPSPSEIASYSFSKLNYGKKIHLFWKKGEAKNSVFDLLLKIFSYENDGYIDPINSQSSYLIKSFLSFINTDFKSYIEEKKEKLERKNYGKPIIDHLNDFASNLSFDEEYDFENIKILFFNYIKLITQHELGKARVTDEIVVGIVNEKNRQHYSVNKPDDVRKNLFYYTNESKSHIKRFQKGQKGITIYFRKDGKLSELESEELF